MSEDIEIEREETSTKGRFIARIIGRAGEGELSYSRSSATLVIADHTHVDTSLRGLGVGAALVERLIATAREEGFKIMPLCPYVRSQATRHPEWADLFVAR